MKMLQDVTDWFKPNILGNQSSKKETIARDIYRKVKEK